MWTTHDKLWYQKGATLYDFILFMHVSFFEVSYLHILTSSGTETKVYSNKFIVILISTLGFRTCIGEENIILLILNFITLGTTLVDSDSYVILHKSIT